MVKKSKKVISVSLNKSTLNKLKDIEKDYPVNKSGLINFLLDKWIDQINKEFRKGMILKFDFPEKD